MILVNILLGLRYRLRSLRNIFLHLFVYIELLFPATLHQVFLKSQISFRLGTKKGPWEMVWVNSQQESE